MKVLVTLDGSEFSEAVLPTASKLATTGAEVVLASVVKASDSRTTWRSTPDYLERAKGTIDASGGLVPVEEDHARPVEDAIQAGERTRVDASEYLERVSNRYFRGNARAEVLQGDEPTRELLGLIETEHPDLVAMATHGRTGLASIVMGSTAQEVLRTGRVPLLLVRPAGLHQLPTGLRKLARRGPRRGQTTSAP